MNDPHRTTQPNGDPAEKLPWIDPELALAPISERTEGGAAAVVTENATYRNS